MKLKTELKKTYHLFLSTHAKHTAIETY